jgi:hypothetical protein
MKIKKKREKNKEKIIDIKLEISKPHNHPWMEGTPRKFELLLWKTLFGHWTPPHALLE